MKKIISILLVTLTLFSVVLIQTNAAAPTYISSEIKTAIRALPLFGTRTNEMLVWFEDTQTYNFFCWNDAEGGGSFYDNGSYPFFMPGASKYESSNGINWTLKYEYAPTVRNSSTSKGEGWITGVANGTGNGMQTILASKTDLSWSTDENVFFSQSTPYLLIPLTLSEKAKEVEFKPLDQVMNLLPIVVTTVVGLLGFWKAWRMLLKALGTA